MYKVLIVDDEEYILDGLMCLLKWEELGLEIAGRASNGLEALEMIGDLEINILITDIKMPEMDGLDLIRKFKNRKPDLKCIILSGFDDFSYVKEAVKLGIENYLLKPIDKLELESTLTNTIEKIEKELQNKIELREGINILRDNILVRWVNNEIEADELEERSRLLGIVLSQGVYLVAIVKIINGILIEDEKIFRLTIQNICTRTLAETGNCIIFTDNSGELVILFSNCEVNKDGLKYYEGILKKCADNIHKSKNVKLFITVGSFEKGYGNVWHSYVNAKKIQDYQLITNDIIVLYNDLEKFNNNDRNPFNIRYKDLYRIVMDKDIGKAESFIEDVYSRLAVMSGLTPSYMQNLTFEMVFYVISNVRSVNPNVDKVLSNLDGFHRRVASAVNITELCEWVKDIARKCISIPGCEEGRISPVIRNTLTYIDQNYKKDINLKVISNDLRINTTYLGYLFKKETGETFTNYLNKVRIEKAKKMLLDESVKVYEVSIAVGYSNSNYFFTLFKKMTGLSPTEFKEMIID